MSVKDYKYRPEQGKGSHRRAGADDEAYRNNFDRIFAPTPKTHPSCEALMCGKVWCSGGDYPCYFNIENHEPADNQPEGGEV